MEFQYQYDQEKLNKAGQREGELTLTSDENMEYKHIYNAGKLVEATNYLITVEGKKPLIGKYKDGNPFDGYFVYYHEFRSPLIDYYENGELKTHYSYSLLDLIASENPAEVQLSKTTYKNKMPLQGLIHKESISVNGMNFCASEYYEEGKITYTYLWMIIGSVLQAVKIVLLPNGYKIHEQNFHNEEVNNRELRFGTITVEFKDNENGTVLYETADKLVIKYQFSNASLSQKIKPYKGKGFICYFLFNDNSTKLTQHYNFEINEQLYVENFISNRSYISLIFSAINIQLTPRFLANGDNDYYFIKMENDYAKMVSLHLGENGNPVDGFFIEKEEQSDNYKYAQYLESKVVANSDEFTLESIKELIFNTKQ
ncbi:hypothetical protein CLU83_1920 [Flavobacterium sp. 1]|uniref:hypothetical protein n=1 Tax=Flavobacterium sp. 1 TaxID=2035200 RepID=UPI000C23EAFB|nr:hypothetical protein [Flavobacterium sp. 1]PJJ08634.1 hypothetical protein CLU83_1920 [Flavobacterium sp. 1]